MIHGVVLRPYQLEAVELMRARGRALLSLCMGAGKTLASLAATEELIAEGVIDRGLVLVPASLKYQWQREIRRYTGRSALVIDGTKAQRRKLYNYVDSFVYTILNYETLVNADDWKFWREHAADFLIVDEITYCKSMTAKRSRRTKFLANRTPIVYGLTGQPVENRAEELFSVMQVVDRTVLGDYRTFDRTFIVRDHWGRPVRYINLKLLRKQMADVMYRKTRDEIADQFPRLVSTVIPFELSPPEKAIYRTAAAYTLSRLADAAERFGSSFSLERHYGDAEDGEALKMRGDIMAGLLMLRLTADDANLIIDSAKRFADDKDDTGSALAHEMREAGVLDNVPAVSTKRKLFAETLAAIFEEDPNNKVVVFSTFKKMISRVQADVADASFTSVQFTGDMNARQKAEAMAQFKDDPDTRLFLSSDAGGYGVDLPEANYLISLDLPWSTGAFEQRESRIIRISSEWEHVSLYTIQATNTIEQRMWEMIAAKRGVSKAFIDGEFNSQGVYVPSLSSLTTFLEEHLD